MKNFKGLLLGLIMGLTLSTSSFVFADTVKQFIGYPASYPIYIDGEQYTPKNPVISVEGRTYIALVEVGDMVGAKVAWNQELRRVEVEKPKFESDIGKEVNREVTVRTGEYIEFRELNELVNPNKLVSDQVLLGAKSVKDQTLYLKYKDKEVIFSIQHQIRDDENKKVYIDISIVNQLFKDDIINQLTKYNF